VYLYTAYFNEEASNFPLFMRELRLGLSSVSQLVLIYIMFNVINKMPFKDYEKSGVLYTTDDDKGKSFISIVSSHRDFSSATDLAQSAV
jgi:hypothetical protein